VAQLVDGVADGLDLVPDDIDGVVAVALRGLLDQWPVPDLDRVGAPRDLHDRRPAEVAGEPLGVDGRRRDDDLQVGAAGEEPVEVPEEEVDVEAALVRLVDDERVVLPELAIGLDLGEQDAVGHQLDEGVVARLVGEAHLVADRSAERGVQLLGDPVGHRAGGQPARLGVADEPPHAAPQLQADLRELGRLPGAGLPGDDHDLVVADGRRDLLLLLADRQLGGVPDLGHGGAAPGQALLGRVDVGGQLGDDRLQGAAVPHLPHAVEATLQAALVAVHQVGQAGLQIGERWCHKRRSHVVAKDRHPAGFPTPG
jgi:hypothetical protein